MQKTHMGFLHYFQPSNSPLLDPLAEFFDTSEEYISVCTGQLSVPPKKRRAEAPGGVWSPFVRAGRVLFEGAAITAGLIHQRAVPPPSMLRAVPPNACRSRMDSLSVFAVVLQQNT